MKLFFCAAAGDTVNDKTAANTIFCNEYLSIHQWLKKLNVQIYLLFRYSVAWGLRNRAIILRTLTKAEFLS